MTFTMAAKRAVRTILRLRAAVAPSHAVALPLPLPLPLAVATACGILTVGMLVLLACDLASARHVFAKVRLAAQMALIVLLTVGLVLGRQTA
jgi:anti-sigma factor RsiW